MNRPPELTCHILDTGHCLAHEHVLIQGGGRKPVACHSLAALLGHPEHGWLLWDAGYAPRMWEATAHFPYSLYRLATPLRLRPELAVAAHLPYVACVNGGIVAQGSPLTVFTEEILSRTFAADMRVIRDEETGGMLIAEAGRHGPFAEPLYHHAHLHDAHIPHSRAALGPDTGLPDHPHDGVLHPREDPFAELAGASGSRGHGA